MRSNRSTRQVYQFILLAAAIILIPALLTYLNYRFSVQNPGGNDFLARWNAGHEWLKNGKNPYSDEVTLSTQMLIYGHPAVVANGEDLNQFAYPLYSLVFIAPFSLMEYNLARASFMTVLEFAMGIICLVSLKLAQWKVKRFTLIALMLVCDRLVLFCQNDHLGSIFWHQRTPDFVGNSCGTTETGCSCRDLGGFIDIQTANDLFAGTVCLLLGVFYPTMETHLEYADILCGDLSGLPSALT